MTKIVKTTKELEFSESLCPLDLDTQQAHTKYKYKGYPSLYDGFAVDVHITKSGVLYKAFAYLQGTGRLYKESNYLETLAYTYNFGDSLTEIELKNILHKLSFDIETSIKYMLNHIQEKHNYNCRKKNSVKPIPYNIGQDLEVVSNNQLNGKTVTVEAVYDNEYGIYYDVGYGKEGEKVTFVMPHHSLILPLQLNDNFFNT